MFGMGYLLGYGGGIINPLSIPGLQLWVDSQTNISPGAVNNAIDSVGDRSPLVRNLSNVSGAGSRPVLANLTTGSVFCFRNGVKNGLYFEGGGDWLSTTGLDTAPAFTLPTGLTVFHTTKHNNANNLANVPGTNTPLNIIGTNGSTVTVFTNVGFSGGQPMYITWEGAAFVTYTATVTTLNDANPHTVCWTHTGTTLNCYVDGVLNKTQTTAAYQSTNGFNSIGAASTNTDGFEGGIAEILVWNSALSGTKAAQLHARAKSLWF